MFAITFNSLDSSHHPQEVLLAQYSLYVHKGGLKPDSFYFIFNSLEPFFNSLEPFLILTTEEVITATFKLISATTKVILTTEDVITTQGFRRECLSGGPKGVAG